MKELTDEQVKKIIEENLTMKFRYNLDGMMNEKRPFGNSGFNQIQQDMMCLLGEVKKWEVSDEDELDNLRFEWMKRCFEDVNEWIKENSYNFRIKLDVEQKDGE